MKLPTIFNCSNDMALAANVHPYFPPKRIQQMEEDLAGLSAFWNEGPWGWSLATKQRYKQMGIDVSELPSDEWLENVRRLSSREFACGYIQDLLQGFADDRLVGHNMRYLSDLTSLLASPFPLIFKSPWSSSGRGVFVANEMSDMVAKRLRGFVSSQGGFVADTFYQDKVLDFAMEFYVHDNQQVEFLGYSVFHAADNGAYGFNYVESQTKLKMRIGIDEQLLNPLIDYHTLHLANLGYHGPVGIDMIKCADGKVHPCIEINLRMNMGILAINLYKRFGDNAIVALTPSRPYGFQACLDEGKLMISYTPKM